MDRIAVATPILAALVARYGMPGNGGPVNGITPTQRQAAKVMAAQRQNLAREALAQADALIAGDEKYPRISFAVVRSLLGNPEGRDDFDLIAAVEELYAYMDRIEAGEDV